MHPAYPKLTINAFAALLAVLAIFFGGNFPLAQGLVPSLCAILFLMGTFLPVYAYSKSFYKLIGLLVFVPVAIVLVWAALQVIPLSPGSGLANPFWNIAPTPAQGATLSAWHSISVNPAATLAYLPYAIGLLLTAVTLYRLGRTNPARTLKVIAVIIAVICTYGILAYACGNRYILWLAKTSYEGNLSGTFINRNSFATFAGLGLLANFGVMLLRVGEISSRLDTRQRLRAFFLLVLRPGWPWMIAAALCFIALVLTSSRAGITASLCGLVVMLGSLAGMRPAVRVPLGTIMGLFILVSIIVFASIGQDLGARLATVGEDATLRQNIYVATGSLTRQTPFTGSGLGTYETAFHSARTPDLLGRVRASVEHAHNTYLELAAELGYPVFALLAVSAVALLFAYLNGLYVRRRAIMWPALGVGVFTLVGGHALADFSLSIPAVAVAAIGMSMLALAQSLPSEEQPMLARSKAFVIAAALSCSLLAAVSLWQSAANYKALKAEPTLRALMSVEPIGPGPMFVAQRNLLKCLDINPWHPTCLQGLAQINLSLASGYGFTGERAGVGLIYLNTARQLYLDALTQSPVNPTAWYRIARIDAYLGNRPQAHIELANSLLTGPAEPVTGLQRVPFMLSMLPDADPDNSILMRTNILDYWQADPWNVATHIIANPAIQRPFFDLIRSLPDDPVASWNRYLKIPLPQAQASGKQSPK